MMRVAAPPRPEALLLIWTAFSLGWLAAAGTGFAAVRDIEVSHEARSLQPGEVVLLRIASNSGILEAQGSFQGHPVSFFPDASGSTILALIGLDLELRPGNHAVRLQLRTESQSLKEVEYPLTVAPKEFPTRHLTVEERFVTPPPEVQERIAREAQLTRQIFATISKERLWEGHFLRPVPGSATSSFGKRNIINGQMRSPHSGTDFRAAEGTPIQAPNRGVVVLAGELYFAGNTVILDHGQGLFSYFAHLSKFTVQVGDLVARGDRVGMVGATGRVTGPHLHWTTRLTGARVDPLSLMSILSHISSSPEKAQ